MINHFEFTDYTLSPVAFSRVPLPLADRPVTAVTDPLLNLDESFMAAASAPTELAPTGDRSPATTVPNHSEAFITGITPDTLRPLADQVSQLLVTDGILGTVNGDRAMLSRASYLFRPQGTTIPAQRVRVGYPLPDDRKKLADVEPWLVFEPAGAEDDFPHVITSNSNYFGAMEFQRRPGGTILLGIGGAEFKANAPADIAAATEMVDGLQANYEARVQAEAAEAQALNDAELATRQLRRKTASIKRRRRIDRLEAWLDRVGLDLEPGIVTNVRSVDELFENSVVIEHSTRSYQSLHAAATAETGLIAKTKELKDKRWLLAGALLSGITVGTLLGGNGTGSYQEMQPRPAAVGALLCSNAFDGTIDHQTFRSELCQRSAAFEVTTTLALSPHGTAELPVDQVIADTAYTRAVPHHFSAHPTDTTINHGLSRYTVAAGTTNRTAKTTGNCAYTGYIGGDFRKGQAVAFGVDPETHAKLTVVNDHDLKICVADASAQTTVFIDQK